MLPGTRLATLQDHGGDVLEQQRHSAVRKRTTKRKILPKTSHELSSVLQYYVIKLSSVNFLKPQKLHFFPARAHP